MTTIFKSEHVLSVKSERWDILPQWGPFGLHVAVRQVNYCADGRNMETDWLNSEQEDQEDGNLGTH